jgi:hypothetical protein
VPWTGRRSCRRRVTDTTDVDLDNTCMRDFVEKAAKSVG